MTVWTLVVAVALGPGWGVIGGYPSQADCLKTATTFRMPSGAHSAKGAYCLSPADMQALRDGKLDLSRRVPDRKP